MTSIIKLVRERKGISQESLAREIGVSRVTLSNFEQGKSEPSLSYAGKIAEILDISMDNLLNNKLTEPVEIHVTPSTHHSSTGESVRIDVPQEKLDKLKEVFLYIISKIGARANVGQTLIYKLLYFIDFDYYEKFEEQIIGAIYKKNHYGPTPLGFDAVATSMIKNNEIQRVNRKFYDREQMTYLPLREPHLELFTGRELAHIDEIIAKHGHKTASEISSLSHKDVPWIIAKDGDIINYESVFYRTDETSVREYKEE